jgi:adenine deaminase
MHSFSISGNFLDLFQQKIYTATVKVTNGKIEAILPLTALPDETLHYIMPGFVDSHVHIESSMLVPTEFARLAVVHGTVGTVSDPHEIANVCGMAGVEFMIENGKKVPFKFNFGAPSCVPATVFETAGASLNAEDVEQLLQRDDIKYLSEMMNFPGVLNGDEEVMKKIKAAHRLGKPVDGHAPGLRGDLAKKYIDAGIYTDHECFTKDEALDKLQLGMKVIIREGSAAKNFDALIDLLNDWPDMILFCSDDKHPDSLVEGHINQLCARAVEKGIDIFKIIKAACINPVHHYKLDIGLLKVGDPADFIVVKDLKKFEVSQTYINGALVADNGTSLIKSQLSDFINHFNCSQKYVSDLTIEWNGETTIPVIGALDGQLITHKLLCTPKVVDDKIVADIENDILKIVVVNRYGHAPIAKGFIKNVGLKHGALASSVAHDSHNIVAVGVDDESMCKAINNVIASNGGIAISIFNKKEATLPLPIAGLMSNADGYQLAAAYTALDKMAKEELSATLTSPFMTLSFMALLVIPHLKLSDKGLFDGDHFCFI